MIINIGVHELFQTEAWELICLLQVIKNILVVRIDEIFEKHIIL